MKILGVIPARYQSTRFPGKPLANICGRTMIQRVYQQAKKVSEFDDVYVATDDERICNVVESFGGKAILTSDKHSTGTDRVAEVAKYIPADWYVNIQGDEPMIEPETIQAVLQPIIEEEDVRAVNLMSKIADPVALINPTIVKVIANEAGRGIFLTRSISPFPRASTEFCYYKSLGIYAFSTSTLTFFKETPRGIVERIEDIEMLRLIENGIYVKFIDVKTNSIAVDTYDDLKKVCRLLNNKENEGSVKKDNE